MAERYMFFNSTATDRRRHQASDMADYWMSFLSSGVIAWDNEPLLDVTTDGTDRRINLGLGRALIKGHLYINDDDDLKHEIETPHASLDRIDRLVLRYDNSIENRYIKSFIIKGDEAEEPTPPALTREGDIYELSLAQIKVVAGKSYIEQSDITDEKLNEDVCGLVNSLATVPTSQFLNDWNEWFRSVKGDTYILDGQFAINAVSTFKSDLDFYGNFATVTKSRSDGTKFMEAILSDPDESDHPTVRTINLYDTDGLNIIDTTIFDIEYNEDGIPINEVIRE